MRLKWTCLGPETPTGRQRCFVRHQRYDLALKCAARGRPPKTGWESHLENCPKLEGHSRECPGDDKCKPKNARHCAVCKRPFEPKTKQQIHCKRPCAIRAADLRRQGRPIEDPGYEGSSSHDDTINPCQARQHRNGHRVCGKEAKGVRRVQGAPGLWVHSHLCGEHLDTWDQAMEWGGPFLYRVKVESV